MMLATIGFQYVIQENVPKTPTITYLDSYVIVCLLLILFVVLGTPRLHPHPFCQPGSQPASRRVCKSLVIEKRAEQLLTVSGRGL